MNNKKISYLQLVHQAQMRFKNFQLQPTLAIIYHLSNQVNDYTSYYCHINQLVDFDVATFWNYLTKLHIDHLPVARIIHTTNFYDKTWIVHDQVFIPRHVTELLVSKCYQMIPQLNLEAAKYVDLCTGSGVVGLMMKMLYPKLTTTLVDLSAEAIKNAQVNAHLHQTPVNFVIGDWYEHLKVHNYQIITANFPYVGLDDPVEPHLVDHEPTLALYASENGWSHYQQLISYLSTNPTWKLVGLEISHHHYHQWLKVIDDHPDWEIRISQDDEHYWRTVIISR